MSLFMLVTAGVGTPACRKTLIYQMKSQLKRQNAGQCVSIRHNENSWSASCNKSADVPADRVCHRIAVDGTRDLSTYENRTGKSRMNRKAIICTYRLTPFHT